MSTGNPNRWQLNEYSKGSENCFNINKHNSNSNSNSNTSQSTKCLLELTNMGINENEDVLLRLLKEVRVKRYIVSLLDS